MHGTTNLKNKCSVQKYLFFSKIVPFLW